MSKDLKTLIAEAYTEDTDKLEDARNELASAFIKYTNILFHDESSFSPIDFDQAVKIFKDMEKEDIPFLKLILFGQPNQKNEMDELFEIITRYF